MRRSSKTKAFTLVELLIVMAIIGLLSIGAIAGGSYAIKQGRISRKKKNVDMISTLLQAYYNDNMDYPKYSVPPTGGVNYTVTTAANVKQVKTLVDSAQMTVYREGFVFNNEPCTADGCYGYRYIDKDKYVLCARLEQDKGNVVNGTTYCYCVGGASLTQYQSVCVATTLNEL